MLVHLDFRNQPVLNAEYNVSKLTQLRTEEPIEFFGTHNKPAAMNIDDYRIDALSVCRAIYIHSVLRQIVSAISYIADFDHIIWKVMGII